MSTLYPDDLSNLDRRDGVGTRGMNQLEAAQILSEGSIWSPTPVKRQTYIAPDLPPVDPRAHVAAARTIFNTGVISILVGAGFVLGHFFGVNA